GVSIAPPGSGGEQETGRAGRSPGRLCLTLSAGASSLKRCRFDVFAIFSSRGLARMATSQPGATDLTTIPLPPPAVPAGDDRAAREARAAAQRARRARGMDRVLAALVLAFVFLISSFAIRNGDFWLHLATGRLIAQGGYTFGSDPFAFTAA